MGALVNGIAVGDVLLFVALTVEVALAVDGVVEGVDAEGFIEDCEERGEVLVLEDIDCLLVEIVAIVGGLKL